MKDTTVYKSHATKGGEATVRLPSQTVVHTGTSHRGTHTPSLRDGARTSPVSGSELLAPASQLDSRRTDGAGAQGGGPQKGPHLLQAAATGTLLQAASGLEMPPRAARMSSRTACPVRLSFLLEDRGPDTGGRGSGPDKPAVLGAPLPSSLLSSPAQRSHAGLNPLTVAFKVSHISFQRSKLS